MPQPDDRDRITVGIDTHKDVHVAVGLDHPGVRLGRLSVPANSAGYRQLERWATDLGPVAVFGLEGTGSYGAGLARHLADHGHQVVEVNRPDRATRYRVGKKATPSTRRWPPGPSMPAGQPASPRPAGALWK
jgi:transposase